MFLKPRQLFFLLMFFSVNTFAAKVTNHSLCHENSRACRTWWSLEMPKASAYWKTTSLKSLEINNKPLEQSSYKKEISLLEAISQHKDSKLNCPDAVLVTMNGAPPKHICPSDLSKSEQEKIRNIFK